nr:Dihydrofolate reductase [uncultured bacterium]
MGRKTWEGLKNPPLPRRRNIVLSRTLADVPGGEILRSPEGLDRLTGIDRAYVIGGEQIYRLLLPHTSEILLTVLDEEAEGDAVFPEFEAEFGEPEVLDRLEGVCEWRRYVRITPTDLNP